MNFAILHLWSLNGKTTQTLNTYYYKCVLLMRQIKKTYFIHKLNNVGFELKRNNMERSKQGGFN
jgi:hypothetical protein